MFEFEKPKIEIAEISEDKKYGRFVVEPLERGYGTTLGNSLRRIMLSSLPGAAVSQIKIDGVLHEFSSIPGVKEDVTEIIMNVKNLAIKNTSPTNESKVAYIEFEGEGIVTAAACVYERLFADFGSEASSVFCPSPLRVNIKKQQPVTIPQTEQLTRLLSEQHLDLNTWLRTHESIGVNTQYTQIRQLTRSEASRIIERLLHP